MSAKKIIIFITFFGVFCNKMYSQPAVLLLQNTSFEDVPGFSRPPRGWFYCGEFGETPPDIHPFNALYGVVQAAKDAYTYVGMVVRENNTWEGLSQWLPQPLEAGQCYQFSIYAARSPYYRSVSRVTGEYVNFNRPVILRLWGGNLHCEKSELLVVSPSIENTDWQRYVFDFQPNKDYNRLVIEVYYESEGVPYNGNILLDQVSPLLPINCEDGKPALALDTIDWSVDLNNIHLADFAEAVTFSDASHQLQEHAFYLPSGELYQANKPLFILSQLLKNAPHRKLLVSLKEAQKRSFRTQSDSVIRALYAYGLQPKQFRVQKMKPASGAPPVKLAIE